MPLKKYNIRKMGVKLRKNRSVREIKNSGVAEMGKNGYICDCI
jgi:hypothetical protein